MRYTVEQDGSYWLVVCQDPDDVEEHGNLCLVPPYFTDREDAEALRRDVERFGLDFWETLDVSVLYPSADMSGRR